MLSKHEHILISAVRCALGRRTYIVELTVDYVIEELPKLSDRCKGIMIEDIEKPIGGYGDECDRQDWMRLLTALKEGVEE